MRVHFFRHGKADKAPRDLDRVLGEVGKQQAATRREKLNGVKFDLVISSPAQRAIDTAAIIAGVPKEKIVISESLYPDPQDGGIGSQIDKLFNLEHLGYAPVRKYLEEKDGGVVLDYGWDAWGQMVHHLVAADHRNVAIFGHAVCLPAIGLRIVDGYPQHVEMLKDINLSECEGFIIELGDKGVVVSVEPICG